MYQNINQELVFHEINETDSSDNIVLEMDLEIEILEMEIEILETEINQELVRLQNHLIICNICPKTFRSRTMLNLHIDLFHEMDETESFDKKVLEMDLEIEILEMEIEILEEEIEMLEIVIIEPGEEISCDICLKTFRTKTTLKLHMEILHKKVYHNTHFRFHACERCPKLFYREHCLTAPIKNKIPCNQCSKSFICQAYLINHLFSHACERCSKLHIKNECSWAVQMQNKIFQVF